MVLVLCEILSVSFRIWTRIAVSISYDDNHYTTGTFTYITGTTTKTFSGGFLYMDVSVLADQRML